jgi:hypothetical protein
VPAPSLLHKRESPAVAGDSVSGASRARTGDLLGAIQALSQLSYSPGRRPWPHGDPASLVAGRSGCPRDQSSLIAVADRARCAAEREGQNRTLSAAPETANVFPGE